MQVNVTIASTVVFTVTFFTSAGVLTVPPSATITITYPLSSNSLTTTSCAVGMTASGSFFTASWATAVAALGITNYSVSAPGQTTATTGQLRLTS
jgi:hypothetical protein